MSEPRSERPRSEKDTVPEFNDGEDALDWMERKLNGSWVDDILEDPKSKGVVGGDDTRFTSSTTPDPGNVTYTTTNTTNPGATGAPSTDQVHNAEPGPSTNVTGYSPDMSGAELAAYLETLWGKETGQA